MTDAEARARDDGGKQVEEQVVYFRPARQFRLERSVQCGCAEFSLFPGARDENNGDESEAQKRSGKGVSQGGSTNV